MGPCHPYNAQSFRCVILRGSLYREINSGQVRRGHDCGWYWHWRARKHISTGAGSIANSYHRHETALEPPDDDVGEDDQEFHSVMSGEQSLSRRTRKQTIIIVRSSKKESMPFRFLPLSFSPIQAQHVLNTSALSMIRHYRHEVHFNITTPPSI